MFYMSINKCKFGWDENFAPSQIYSIYQLIIDIHIWKSLAWLGVNYDKMLRKFRASFMNIHASNRSFVH